MKHIKEHKSNAFLKLKVLKKLKVHEILVFKNLWIWL